MKSNICALLVAAFVTTGLLGAQGLPCPGTPIKHTLPAGLETIDAGSYSLPTWSFNTANTTRWQFAYPWTEFVHQAPITVCAIAFRSNVDTNMMGGTYGGVDVTLATSANPWNQMSTTFANNLGPDATLVVQGGTVNEPVYTATGVTPAPFNLTIPFTTDVFRFDPSLQQDLVIDITVNGPINYLGFTADGIFPNTAGSQTGHISSPAAGVANWQNLDAGPVIEITYSLGSDQHFNLQAITNGGGSGNLFLGYQNIPAGTVEGYTLLSLVPYGTVVPGAEFGTGPMFGIFPENLTFSILFSPAAPGNPLHWTWPAAPPLFPGSSINLQTGALTIFAGQTWELVGLALGPGFTLLGITAPAQLNW